MFLPCTLLSIICLVKSFYRRFAMKPALSSFNYLDYMQESVSFSVVEHIFFTSLI